jgi:hypothetical protein
VGGKRRNVSGIIKKRTSAYAEGQTFADGLQCVDRVSSRRRNIDSSMALANAVRAKLEEGNMRAAIQIISSEDTVAPENDETWSDLKSKHPTGSPIHTDLVLDSSLPDLVVNQDKVRKVIASFPPGSAGGPDGLRPQHVKELLHCREAGLDFIDSLTDFVNVVLSGRCPPDVAPFFFGG